jgi:hypothetical protein
MPKKLQELSFDERNQLPRSERLLYDMRTKKQWAHNKGRRIEHYIDFCWWGSVTLAGIATLAGFIAPVPEIETIFQIKPWMISLITAIAAGLRGARNRMPIMPIAMFCEV